MFKFLNCKRGLFFIAIFVFMYCISCKNTTEAVIFAPDWTEFCPPRYCESNENMFSKDATYWYKRRLQFDSAVQKCSLYKGEEQNSCYEEIRASERRKNEVWNVRQEEKNRTTEYNREYNKERMEFYGINQILETIKK